MTSTLVPPHKPLTHRENLFVTELLRDGNQAAAYRRSGYKSKSPHVHASRLVAKGSIRAELDRRRSAAMATLERSSIATLGEVKTALTSQLRGSNFEDDIKNLETEISGLAGSAKFSAMVELVRLKLARNAESGRAAVSLAKLKGALDPWQKPVGDRKKAIDTLMMSIIKNTDGPSLLAQMKAAGAITDV